MQSKILENVSKYVKKGGYLCYSTCTVNKKENEDQAEKLVSDGRFKYEALNFLPDAFKDKAKEGHLSLMQGVDDSDGFFIAILKKKA